jgi:hypothetical protein
MYKQCRIELYLSVTYLVAVTKKYVSFFRFAEMEKPEIVESESEDDKKWPLTAEDLAEMEILKDLHKKIPNKDERYPYLMRFRSNFPDFKLPEIDSIAKMFKIPIEYDQTQARLAGTKHSKYMVVARYTSH